MRSRRSDEVRPGGVQSGADAEEDDGSRSQSPPKMKPLVIARLFHGCQNHLPSTRVIVARRHG